MLGLLEAGAKYDGGKGASFETYAGIRIRGAMLDEIRRGDWAPRSVHRKARKVAEAIRGVESRTGREAQDKDVAAALDMSMDEYYRILQDAAGCRLFSYDELSETDESPELVAEKSAADVFESDSFRSGLAEAINGLPGAGKTDPVALLRRRAQSEGNRSGHRGERIPDQSDSQPDHAAVACPAR